MPTTAPNLDSPFHVAGRTLDSRLIVGTGKYADYPTMQEALSASGARAVTVAVRRERLVNEKGESLLDFIDTSRYTILPNTAGCFTADDAVRVARLGREILDQLDNPGKDWVKLEVLADKKTLLPDPVGTLQACAELVKDGFKVLCYTSDDPVMAVKIKQAGASSVMPAGSPIGSGQGVLNPNAIRIILELLKEGDSDVSRHRGRRRRDGQRRHDRHGTGCRRRAPEHRHRPRQGPGAHGPRDAPRPASRTFVLPRRPDRQKTLRHRFQPLGRRDQLHPRGIAIR